MAPVIRISDATFDKLKLIAEPFVDTPDAVINRCLDYVLESRGIPNPDSQRNGNGADYKELDPVDPGELKHTSVRQVVINDVELPRPSWNQMLRQLHVLALENLGSVAEVMRASGANIREGRYEEEGFHYIPEADLSIQGQDSNQAWANGLRMAKRLSVPLEVAFRWHQKDGAAHPGELGRISWAPGA